MEISLQNLYVDVGLKEPRLWYKSPWWNKFIFTVQKEIRAESMSMQ